MTSASEIRPDSRAARWVAFVERRHRAILVISAVLTLLSALSLFALRLDFDVLDMLPTGTPAFDSFKTFVTEFGELDQLVILVEAKDANTTQSFAEAFAGRLRALPEVVHVQSRLDVDALNDALFERFLFNYLPLDAYAKLEGRLTADGIDAQVSLNRALLQAPLDLSTARLIRRDPLGLTRLASDSLDAAFSESSLNLQNGYLTTRDGRAVLLFVRPTQNAFDIPFTTRLMQHVRAAEAETRAEFPAADVRVAYSGSYVFALEDAATLRWDVGRYTLSALIGVMAIFYFGYPNLRILPFVTYPLVVSTLLTFPLSLLFYDNLNAVSLSFAAILYGLSVDSAIHYFTRLSQEAQGRELRTAVTRTVARLGGANVVASTTTAAVFFVIGFSQLAGVSELGFLTAVGMLINTVQFFLLYPAMSFWMKRPGFSVGALDTPRLGRMAAACARHAGLVIAAAAVLTAMLAIAARRVQLDVDLTHLRPGDSPAARVDQEIMARFGMTHAPGAILVRAASLEEALQQSERVEARLRDYRARGLVHGARGITALLPSERTQRERLARFERLPRAQIAKDLQIALRRHGFQPAQFSTFIDELTQPQTALLSRDDPALQPLEPLLSRHIRVGDHGAMVAIYTQTSNGTTLDQVGDQLRRDEPDVSLIVASRQLLEHELDRMLRRELAGFFLASFAINLLLILISSPHLGTAIAILLPQLSVVVFCLALMHLSGIGLDPVNIIVIPLILGIGVDHCVYVAERWQHGEDLAAALRHGGRALCVSGLTTAAGFGFLAFSRYPALAHMGMLAAASLTLCVIAAFTLFPALLIVLGPRAVRSSQLEAVTGEGV